MKEKSILFIVFLMVSSVLITSCGVPFSAESPMVNIHISTNPTENADQTGSSPSGDENSLATEDSLPFETLLPTDASRPIEVQSSDEIKFEESSKTGHLATGRLIHTIKGVRIVTHESGIPQTGSFADYRPACTYDSNGIETIWNYPEFIMSDGFFIPNVCLVLLDIEITNEDARNWTIQDLDERGNPKGFYADPYIFRIDGKYRLREMNSLPDSEPFSWIPAFFSKLNIEEEHPFAYRLLPGETESYTIGFLIGNNYDGTPRAISDLCIRIPFGLLGSGDEYETLIALVK